MYDCVLISIFFILFFYFIILLSKFITSEKGKRKKKKQIKWKDWTTHHPTKCERLEDRVGLWAHQKRKGKESSF